jgi:hypothetical protein
MDWPLVVCLHLRADLFVLLRDELSEYGIRLESWALRDPARDLPAFAERLSFERPAALMSALLFPFSDHLALLRAAARYEPGREIPLLVLANTATGLTRAGEAAGDVRILKPPYEVSALCREIREALDLGR